MIETLDYGLQFLILLAGAVYAGYHAARERERGWVLLGFFYVCYALGDLYWLLCMALEGKTPEIYFISELSWIAGYLFACLLLRLVQARRESPGTRLAWLAPVFAAAACLYFFQWGNYAVNLADALVMGWLGFLILRGLAGAEKGSALRRFYLLLAVFFLAEYAGWFASCSWMGDTPANPYFWFDAAMTLAMALIAPAYGKAMAE